MFCGSLFSGFPSRWCRSRGAVPHPSSQRAGIANSLSARLRPVWAFVVSFFQPLGGIGVRAAPRTNSDARLLIRPVARSRELGRAAELGDPLAQRAAVAVVRPEASQEAIYAPLGLDEKV